MNDAVKKYKEMRLGMLKKIKEENEK